MTNKETIYSSYGDNEKYKDIIQPLKEEAESIRDKIIKEIVIPTIKDTFDKYNKLKSSTLMLSQFWCDEADDAVHADLIFSQLEEPDLISAEKFELKNKHDTVNLPSYTKENKYGGYYCNFDINKNNNWNKWDDNGEAITAFACFCKEYCHQEMVLFEAYTPYAVFKKKGNELEMKIIGEKFRPWLEGVIPESDNV